MRSSLSLAILATFSAAFAAVPSDEVTNLVGFGNVISKTYSGYLNANNGKYLHYFLTYSLNNPSTDPIILWFNGKYCSNCVLWMFNCCLVVVFGESNPSSFFFPRHFFESAFITEFVSSSFYCSIIWCMQVVRVARV
jgi:hypothetical protein